MGTPEGGLLLWNCRSNSELTADITAFRQAEIGRFGKTPGKFLRKKLSNIKKRNLSYIKNGKRHNAGNRKLNSTTVDDLKV